MWYTMPDSTKHYPVSIEWVKKIQAQNKQGIKPDALETVEVISGKPKEVEPAFVDVVGQISLRTLERNTKKRRDKERDSRSQGNNGNPRDRSHAPQGPLSSSQQDRPPKSQGSDNQRSQRQTSPREQQTRRSQSQQSGPQRPGQPRQSQNRPVQNKPTGDRPPQQDPGLPPEVN